jgi:hypothetical protein
VSVWADACGVFPVHGLSRGRMVVLRHARPRQKTRVSPAAGAAIPTLNFGSAITYILFPRQNRTIRPNYQYRQRPKGFREYPIGHPLQTLHIRFRLHNLPNVVGESATLPPVIGDHGSTFLLMGRVSVTLSNTLPTPSIQTRRRHGPVRQQKRRRFRYETLTRMGTGLYNGTAHAALGLY